jgi:hypothetical protein
MDFKTRIQEQIVNPADRIRGKFSTVAMVTNSDERNNVCSIQFIDKDGYRSNKDSVPVKIYSPGIIGWFPVEGDFVTIEESNGRITITGKHEGGYAASIRSKSELKKDIFSDNGGGAFAGLIL